MRYFKALNILNRVSMIFMIVNLISILFVLPPVRGYFYPWVCLLALFIYYLKEKNTKGVYAAFALTFVPIIFLSSLYEVFLTSIAFGMPIYFVYNYRAKLDFNLTLSNFKRETRAIFVVTIIALLLLGSKKISDYVAAYILINLITYTVILRTARFMEHNHEDEKINRINTIYGVFAGIAAVVISVDEVRQVIGKLLYLAYLGIMKIFYYISMVFIFIFGNALDRFVMWVKNAGEGKVAKGGAPGEPDNDLANLDKYFITDFFENEIVQTIGQFLLLLLILFVLYRILKKYWLDRTENYNDDQFIEEKETILRDELSKRRGVIARIAEAFKSKTLEEQIRHQYAKLLRTLKSRGVEINENNTSLEVNKKSAHIYEKNILDEIREIYIVIRYGEKKADKAVSKRFSELVKKGDK